MKLHEAALAVLQGSQETTSFRRVNGRTVSLVLVPVESMEALRAALLADAEWRELAEAAIDKIEAEEAMHDARQAHQQACLRDRLGIAPSTKAERRYLWRERQDAVYVSIDACRRWRNAKARTSSGTVASGSEPR